MQESSCVSLQCNSMSSGTQQPVTASLPTHGEANDLEYGSDQEIRPLTRSQRRKQSKQRRYEKKKLQPANEEREQAIWKRRGPNCPWVELPQLVQLTETESTWAATRQIIEGIAGTTEGVIAALVRSSLTCSDTEKQILGLLYDEACRHVHQPHLKDTPETKQHARNSQRWILDHPTLEVPKPAAKMAQSERGLDCAFFCSASNSMKLTQTESTWAATRQLIEAIAGTTEHVKSTILHSPVLHSNADKKKLCDMYDEACRYVHQLNHPDTQLTRQHARDCQLWILKHPTLTVPDLKTVVPGKANPEAAPEPTVDSIMPLVKKLSRADKVLLKANLMALLA